MAVGDPPDPQRQQRSADQRAGHDRADRERAEPEIGQIDRQQQRDKAVAKGAHGPCRQYPQRIGRCSRGHWPPPLFTLRAPALHQRAPRGAKALILDKTSGPFVTPNAKVTPARISPAVALLTRAPRSPRSTAIFSWTCQIAPIRTERVRNRPTSRSK